MTAEKLLAELQRAWNAGDGAAWGATFAEDADFVDVLGRLHRGRDTIAEIHQAIFDSIYKGSEVAFRLISSRELGGGLELAHSTSRLQVPAGPRKGMAESTQTMVAKSGHIVAFHNTFQADFATFVGEG